MNKAFANGRVLQHLAALLIDVDLGKDFKTAAICRQDADNPSCPQFMTALLENTATTLACKSRCLRQRRKTSGKVLGNTAVPFTMGQRFPFAQGVRRHQATNSEKSNLSLTVHLSLSPEKSSSVIPAGAAICFASRNRDGPCPESPRTTATLDQSS